MKCQEFVADIIQHLNIMRLEKEIDVSRQICCASLINKVLSLYVCEKEMKGAIRQEWVMWVQESLNFIKDIFSEK